jgi:hypothetical protein
MCTPFEVQLRVARFFSVQHTKTGKICVPNDHKMSQMTLNYTNWLQNRPNGNKIYQRLPLQDPPKIYPNWDFLA